SAVVRSRDTPGCHVRTGRGAAESARQQILAGAAPGQFPPRGGRRPPHPAGAAALGPKHEPNGRAPGRDGVAGIAGSTKIATTRHHGTPPLGVDGPAHSSASSRLRGRKPISLERADTRHSSQIAGTLLATRILPRGLFGPSGKLECVGPF